MGDATRLGFSSSPFPAPPQFFPFLFTAFIRTEPRWQIVRTVVMNAVLAYRFISVIPPDMPRSSIAFCLGMQASAATCPGGALGVPSSFYLASQLQAVLGVALPLFLSLRVYYRSVASFMAKKAGLLGIRPGKAHVGGDGKPDPTLSLCHALLNPGSRPTGALYSVAVNRIARRIDKYYGIEPGDITEEDLDRTRRVLAKQLQSQGHDDLQVSVTAHPGCLLLGLEVIDLGGRRPGLDRRRLQDAVDSVDMVSLLPERVRARITGSRTGVLAREPGLLSLSRSLEPAASASQPIGQLELRVAVDDWSAAGPSFARDFRPVVWSHRLRRPLLPEATALRVEAVDNSIDRASVCLRFRLPCGGWDMLSVQLGRVEGGSPTHLEGLSSWSAPLPLLPMELGAEAAGLDADLSCVLRAAAQGELSTTSAGAVACRLVAHW